ncbi:adenosylcobinamide-GDP ribazoletransferase [Salaquimonas pukyongi]|uniref:adenosylcobinamide-GDP ribazoletransferase n=1 Tax=Salaquimonas pukyongi TaxID=2712698 RepID=UPI00096B9BC6|nr:adenosylcobinamide-GDP ribazoletransferase [Salaquimonas pukyongi]
MNDTLQDLLAALRFFTRLPLPEDSGEGKPLATAATGFPFAGFVVGALAALVWAISATILPALPAAGLAIAAGLLVTGALHEDGLSDCADGLGGGTTRQRALEIMRDSRIGAFGAAALIMTIGLRWASLAELTMIGGVLALLTAHTVSRAAILPALVYSSYARKEGLASTVAGGIHSSQLFITIVISLLLALLFGGLVGLAAASVAFALAFAFLKYLEARLGGYTGDGLGAMQQIAEISVMLFFCAAWT